jgi:hypothetical protein
MEYNDSIWSLPKKGVKIPKSTMTACMKNITLSISIVIIYMVFILCIDSDEGLMLYPEDVRA